MSQDSVPPLLAEIDAARRQLRSTLARVPETVITQRPPSGEWSVLENVRHLLFAEQAHMGRLFHERPVWSPHGFTPETMRVARKLPPLGADGSTFADVWAEWNRIHRQTARRLKTVHLADTEVALARHLRHLRAHVAIIERLVRQAAK